MRGLLIRWLLNAGALLITDYLLAGVHFRTPVAALVAAVVFSAVNAVVRPILFLLTLPLNILTLGLFTLVLNGLVFSLVAALVPGFTISGFGAAVVGSLVLGIINWALNTLVETGDR